VGLTIQLCMPLPSHILQTVMMNSVTQIRASGDYQRQVYDNNNWAIGYTSMLHHALGVFPFKDCFWSSNQTQTGCVAKVCVEPNAVLETLSALLSTGPVGPADKIGFLDKGNLMQTCRSDGILLKPDIPAITMDLVFSTGFKTQPTLYNLSHTFSKHTVKDSSADNLAVWHYILAADTGIDFTITVQDIGASVSDNFFVFDYFMQPTSLKPFNKANPLMIGALHPNGTTVDFKYYVIVPSLGGYTLIGERNKFTVASNRFGPISKTSSTTAVTVFGSQREKVTVEVLHEPSQMVESYDCVLGSEGTTLLSCVDASTHSCTC